MYLRLVAVTFSFPTGAGLAKADIGTQQSTASARNSRSIEIPLERIVRPPIEILLLELGRMVLAWIYAHSPSRPFRLEILGQLNCFDKVYVLLAVYGYRLHGNECIEI